jgi:hypothetical protein
LAAFLQALEEADRRGQDQKPAEHREGERARDVAEGGSQRVTKKMAQADKARRPQRRGEEI